MATYGEALALAKAFEAENKKADYWEIDTTSGNEQIIITMKRVPKGGVMKLRKAVIDEGFWVSSGPVGSPCACCGGSGKG